jgi:MYXO-CTERM domain-containing protein
MSILSSSCQPTVGPWIADIPSEAIMRKLLLLTALAVVSAPILVVAKDCKQSGDNQGNNPGCRVRMDDGDSVRLTAGTAALACLAGYFFLRRRKVA